MSNQIFAKDKQKLDIIGSPIKLIGYDVQMFPITTAENGILENKNILKVRPLKVNLSSNKYANPTVKKSVSS